MLVGVIHPVARPMRLAGKAEVSQREPVFVQPDPFGLVSPTGEDEPGRHLLDALDRAEVVHGQVPAERAVLAEPHHVDAAAVAQPRAVRAAGRLKRDQQLRRRGR